VAGRLEIGDLKAEVLCAEVFLRAERDQEGDPTHGVGRLAMHDAEERLVALHEPLEVEVHLLRVSTKMMLSPLPSLMRVWPSKAPSMLGSTTSGYDPGSGMWTE
jgi:hypothetical protein